MVAVKTSVLVTLLVLGACNAPRREQPVGVGVPVASAPSAAASTSPPAPTAAAARQELLYDYGATSTAARPVPAEPAAPLLSKVVAEVARLSPEDERACVRRAARIVAGASGAFRAPGKTEQLYVVDTSECGPRAAASEHAWAVLVAAGAEPRAYPASATAIDAVADLDGDGVSSLLLSAGSTGQGVTVVFARIVDFRGGDLHVRQNLEEVLHDGCGSPARSAMVSKRVVVERAAGKARIVATENPPRVCDG